MSLLDLIDDRDGRPRFVVFVLVAMLVVGCCIVCRDFEYMVGRGDVKRFSVR